jgi:ubiquinone/menaquinone biosynthesis C-methylase UbiE
MAKHVCPWWMAYTFDNPIRRIFHNSEKIFSPYRCDGMTAVDIGCGMGYFSIGMAKIVGDTGRVISIDIQQEMLDILIKRAKKAGVDHRITPVLCDDTHIDINKKVDFVLAFWMAHETPDELKFLEQVKSILKNSGKFLLAEPKLHVSFKDFKKTISLAEELGFKIVGAPDIALSHTAVFEFNHLEGACEMLSSAA